MEKKRKSTGEKEAIIYKSIIYVPEISERFEKSKLFNSEKYKIAHKTDNCIEKFYSKNKDKVENKDKSNVIYRVSCNGNGVSESCDMVYVGTTKNKLKTRLAGHKSDIKLRNTNNNSNKTALTAHCKYHNHSPDLDNVRVLQVESRYRHRYMLEALNIMKVPYAQRMNFKSDTENIGKSFRYLVNKRICK